MVTAKKEMILIIKSLRMVKPFCVCEVDSSKSVKTVEKSSRYIKIYFALSNLLFVKNCKSFGESVDKTLIKCTEHMWEPGAGDEHPTGFSDEPLVISCKMTFI